MVSFQSEFETQNILGKFLACPGRGEGLFLDDGIPGLSSRQRPRSIAYWLSDAVLVDLEEDGSQPVLAGFCCDDGRKVWVVVDQGVRPAGSPYQVDVGAL